MFIWVDWICKKCDELHVARFDVIIYSGAFHDYTHKEAYFYVEDIKIHDVAHNREQTAKKTKGGGSKIFAPFDTEIKKLFDALKNYMPLYYSIKEGTLSMELCNT